VSEKKEERLSRHVVRLGTGRASATRGNLVLKLLSSFTFLVMFDNLSY
jgi:hypothetical protein